MTVKLTSGAKGLFPLTSPPPKPIPPPDKTLIAKVVTYADREITVTIPFPDTLELVAEVVNDLLAVPDQSGKSAKAIYSELDKEIQSWLLEIATNPPSGTIVRVNLKNPTWAKFWIAYDEKEPLNRAYLALSRKAGGDYASWKLKFEFSPAKAGPAGFLKLTAGLEALLPFLSVPKLICAFSVARADAAIDLIGATPLDLIAHISKPGKRLVYVGSHGRPETVYLYELKQPLKSPPKQLGVRTTGPNRLKLYERRDYQLQLMLQPPYGPSPVTRAEVTRRWTKKRPLLTTLVGIDNFFAGRRVAYAAAIPTSDPRAWRQFCLAAFGGGIDKSLFSWLPGPGPKFAKAYNDCGGDLIDAGCWSGWDEGVERTGLSHWINFP